MDTRIEFDLRKKTAVINLLSGGGGDYGSYHFIDITENDIQTLFRISGKIINDTGPMYPYAYLVDALRAAKNNEFKSLEAFEFLLDNMDDAFSFVPAITHMHKTSLLKGERKDSNLTLLKTHVKMSEEIRKGLRWLAEPQPEYPVTPEEDQAMFNWFLEDPANAMWIGRAFYYLKERGLMEGAQGTINFLRWQMVQIGSAVKPSEITFALGILNEKELIGVSGSKKPEWQKLFDIFLENPNQVQSISQCFLNLIKMGLGTDTNLQMIIQQKAYLNEISDHLYAAIGTWSPSEAQEKFKQYMATVASKEMTATNLAVKSGLSSLDVKQMTTPAAGISAVRTGLGNKKLAIKLVCRFKRTVNINFEDFSPTMALTTKSIDSKIKNNNISSDDCSILVDSVYRLEKIKCVQANIFEFLLDNIKYATAYTKAIIYLHKVSLLKLEDVNTHKYLQNLASYIQDCEQIQQGLSWLAQTHSKYPITPEQGDEMFKWFLEFPHQAEGLGFTFYALKRRGLLDGSLGEKNFMRWQNLHSYSSDASLMGNALLAQDHELECREKSGVKPAEWQKLFDIFLLNPKEARSIMSCFSNLKTVGLGTDENLKMIVEQKLYASDISSLLYFLRKNTQLLNEEIFRGICSYYQAYAGKLRDVFDEFENEVTQKEKLGKDFLNLENYLFLIGHRMHLDDIKLNLKAAIATWNPSNAQAKFKQYILTVVAEKKALPSLTLFSASNATAADMKKDYKETLAKSDSSSLDVKQTNTNAATAAAGTFAPVNKK